MAATKTTERGAEAGPALIEGLDPVTFEVIRHRLWAINDEQARMGARLSGSPIVFEGYDFNAGLVTGDGRGLYTGVYILQHGATIDTFVRNILELWDRDRIAPGDMFFTNDPWYGALHANDGIVAMPVFWEDEIVLWSGIVMHDNDVGSPVPSSFVVGSEDRFGEAPLIPPMKLASEFVPFDDVERLYLRNTRSADHNALNMRARVAALKDTYSRVTEIIEQYGIDAFMASQEGILKYVERVVGGRLEQIPDGEWFAEIIHDHDSHTDELYPIRCTLRNRGGRLEVDFAGTAKQAPGPINCARPASEAAFFGVMLTHLCYDLPWAIGALRSLVEIKMEEETVINAVSPAPVSLASTMATLSCQDAAANAFSKMLLSSEDYATEVSGSWTPGVSGAFMIGVDRNFEQFFAIAPDCFGGGGGARSFQDGVDTGGIYHSMASRTGNVETMESRASILELYRREMPDSGGAGRFRGGVALEELFVPHKIGAPAVCNTWASGVAAPGGRGLSGGAPGGAAAHVVLRGTNVRKLFADGKMPSSRDEIEVSEVDIQAAKDLTTLGEEDLRWGVVPAGAGYGDPVRRDPDAVAADVRGGFVSEGFARSVYGVVLRDGEVDASGTEAEREEIRAARLQQGKPVAKPVAGRRVEGGEILHPISDTVEAVQSGSGREMRCTVCQQFLGDYGDDHKQAALVRDLPLTAICPHNDLCRTDDFVAREFCCPECGTRFALDIQLRDDPVMMESRFGAAFETG